MRRIVLLSILTLTIIGALYYWWIYPVSYFVPGASLTVIDSDTEKPISNVLVEIRWAAKGMEGYTLRTKWCETLEDGKIEVEPQTFELGGDTLEGLSVDLKHPLYEWQVWRLGPGSFHRNDQIAFTKVDRSPRIETVRLKSYENQLKGLDNCNWEPNPKLNLQPTNPGSLVDNYSWYLSALSRSHIKLIDGETIKTEIKDVLEKLFISCPEKKIIWIQRLERK